MSGKEVCAGGHWGLGWSVDGMGGRGVRMGEECRCWIAIEEGY